MSSPNSSDVSLTRAQWLAISEENEAGLHMGPLFSRAKMERQMEVDQNIKLTQELDTKWRDLHSLLHHNERTSKAKHDASQPDSFDLLVSELQYAPRAGVAMDKTKTQEEIAEEERDRLEELEKERRARAAGDESLKNKPKVKHVSADDLDDNFAVAEDGE